MDKMTRYRELVRRLFEERAGYGAHLTASGIEKLLVMDDERGHYMLLKLGWDHGKRVRWITVYLRVKEGKIWIEQDLTEEGIGHALLAAGVPHDDIVPAFHDPDLRQFMDFAAA
ncbi:MAG: XisI protein [Blastocatellia bacterium]